MSQKSKPPTFVLIFAIDRFYKRIQCHILQKIYINMVIKYPASKYLLCLTCVINHRKLMAIHRIIHICYFVRFY